jgi:DNA-binding transcriptional MerR regulator
MTTTNWLTLAEAAKALNISQRTIRRWIRAGKVDAELRSGPNGPQYYLPAEQIGVLRREAQVNAMDAWNLGSQPTSHLVARRVRDQLREELWEILHDVLHQSNRELDRRLTQLETQVTQFRTELKAAIDIRGR